MRAGRNSRRASSVTPPMHLRRLILVLAGAAVLSLTARPARTVASCAMAAPIARAVADAELVFVGTVTTTAQRNLWATVTVAEVWRGPDLPAVMQVHGGEGGNSATSVDREFTAGTKYLFVPGAMQDGIALDNACSPTQVWDDSLAGLRPSDARGPIGGAPPAPAGFDVVGALLPFGVAILVAGVLVAVGLVARSRRSD